MSKPDESSIFEALGMTITVCHAANDGTRLIFIDTCDEMEHMDGPLCRIYLNDGDPLWENPPMPPKED